MKDELSSQKDALQKKLDNTIELVSESKKFKINQINTGIDKKSKQILCVVSDILSSKLSKILVDEIIEDIINALNAR